MFSDAAGLLAVGGSFLAPKFMTCVTLHNSTCHLQRQLTAYALLPLQIILCLDLFCPAKLLLLLPLCKATGLSKTHPGVAQIVNCAGLVSKWVGDTPKNIDALFQEARATDAVLCFDEAEGLFGTRSSDMGNSTDRYAAMDVGEYPSQHQM